MKKILVLLLVFVGLSVSAQTSKYVSVGLSTSNAYGSTFKEASYASIEGGIVKHNVAYGVAFGRGSLAGLGNSQDNLKAYYVEAKVAPSFKLGYVDGSVIMGFGSFLDDHATFIEYGLGVSKTLSSGLIVGVAATNWNGTNYLTPSIGLSF